MEMFSKELYELDKNTVQYMIDELQDTIDAQKDELVRKDQTIEELHRKNDEMYDQSIVSTISILRGLNIPEQEILSRISEQYQIDEAQVRKYL